jgi:hypothetical protein
MRARFLVKRRFQQFANQNGDGSVTAEIATFFDQGAMPVIMFGRRGMIPEFWKMKNKVLCSGANYWIERELA